MGIMQTFCQELYKEIKTYEANKTRRKKKLNPIRQQDITQLTQILETAEKQNPTNIRILHQDVMNFLGSIKTARFIGFPIASDLCTQLRQVLARPQFDPAQMVIIELQEQQANQCYINIQLNTRLTQHEQEIALLNENLEERDHLCETLINKCNVLKIENAQLKESLKACADENTAGRLNQLHTQVAEQQTTIAKLTSEYEKEKSENQQLKKENQRLQEENRKLKNGSRENTSSSTEQPVAVTCYSSPLKSKSPHPRQTTINTTTLNSNNSVELKTYGT
jgi:hypothetical protein